MPPKKNIGKRQYRQKDAESESDGEKEKNDQVGGEEDGREVLLEALELRRYRKRPVGMGARELIVGDSKSKSKPKEEPEDPWKMKTGGLVDFSDLKDRQEFIEKELKKRKSSTISDDPGSSSGANGANAVDDELFIIPDHLQVSSKFVSEGNVTLSAAMLTAIPEVDLGISAKLKNIEQTEKAKRDLILKKNTKDDDYEEDIKGVQTT
ncbi:hypothetical protein HDU67_007519 [Dinochytrium kinnereticum]|nr:hypothetical protein HDU67_007519 [Dinochytrium kinnereticum]